MTELIKKGLSGSIKYFISCHRAHYVIRSSDTEKMRFETDPSAMTKPRCVLNTAWTWDIM